MGAQSEVDVFLRKRLEPESDLIGQASGRSADLPQAMADRRIAAPERRHAACLTMSKNCARSPLRGPECGTLRWPKVNDVLARANACAESKRRMPEHPPSAFASPRHRLRGLVTKSCYQDFETSI